MKRKTAAGLLAAIAIAGAVAGAALAATAGPAVTVQIKTLTKTLQSSIVHGEQGSITKGGAPRGKCPGNSAAGALDSATHGRWKGTYSAKYTDIFVTSILGSTAKSPDFWGFYVNGKFASHGICETRLHAGERLLFKLTK